MTRARLRQIITEAAQKAACTDEQTARLVATADQTDSVAVGEFYISEGDLACGCPALLAGYYEPAGYGEVRYCGGPENQAVRDFPFAFDSLIISSGEPLLRVGADTDYIEVTD